MTVINSKLKSIFKLACPKCRQGDIFKHRNPYALREFDKMHERCPKCNLKYEKEVGFFYGSMFVSYGITVIVGVAIFVALKLFLPSSGPRTWITFICSTIVLLIPVTYRLSRSVWIHMFTVYDPNAIEINKQKE